MGQLRRLQPACAESAQSPCGDHAAQMHRAPRRIEGRLSDLSGYPDKAWIWRDVLGRRLLRTGLVRADVQFNGLAQADYLEEIPAKRLSRRAAAEGRRQAACRHALLCGRPSEGFAGTQSATCHVFGRLW